MTQTTAAPAVVLKTWPKELHFERGGVHRLGALLDTLGARRALVITGKTVAGGSIGAAVRTALGSRLAVLYDGVLPHTPLPTVEEAAALFAGSGADALISVGGGSATDTAKAVAVRLAGELNGYRLDLGAPRRALPASTPAHLAVPTVTGAGNVLLPSAGILDPATHVKMLFDDPALIPQLSLLDAELLVHCGPELSVGHRHPFDRRLCRSADFAPAQSVLHDARTRSDPVDARLAGPNGARSARRRCPRAIALLVGHGHDRNR